MKINLSQIDLGLTESDVRTETTEILKEADNLRTEAKEKNPEISNQFKKEYEDIREATIEALRTERRIIKDELSSLRNELGDLQNEASKGQEVVQDKFKTIVEGRDTNINKINNILQTYKGKNIRELLENESDRRELLKTDTNRYGGSINIVIGDKKNNYISDIKEQILEKEKQIIRDILKSTNITNYDENRILNTNNVGGNPKLFIEYIKGLIGNNGEKLNEENIKKITDFKKISYGEKGKNTIDNILTKYGQSATIEEISKMSNEEFNIFMREAKMEPEDSKIFLKGINAFNTIKTLNDDVNMYNKEDTGYFLENPEMIINITDQKKALIVIKEYNDKKNVNSDTIRIKDDINPILKTDIDFIIKLINTPNFNTLSVLDLKDLNLNNINSEQAKILFNKLDNNQKATFIYFLNEKIKKELKRDDKIGKEIIGIEEIQESNILADTKTIDDFLEGKETTGDRKETNEIDNYFYNIFKNGNDSERNTLIERMEGGINRITLLPKTIKAILENKTTIESFIKQSYIVYYMFLPEDRKPDFSVIYTKAVLKQEGGEGEKERALSSIIPPNNKEDIIKIFKLLKENKINLKELFYYPKTKQSFKIFIENNKNTNLMEELQKEPIFDEVIKILGENEENIAEKAKNINIIKKNRITDLKEFKIDKKYSTIITKLLKQADKTKALKDFIDKQKIINENGYSEKELTEDIKIINEILRQLEAQARKEVDKIEDKKNVVNKSFKNENNKLDSVKIKNIYDKELVEAKKEWEQNPENKEKAFDEEKFKKDFIKTNFGKLEKKEQNLIESLLNIHEGVEITEAIAENPNFIKQILNGDTKVWGEIEKEVDKKRETEVQARAGTEASFSKTFGETTIINSSYLETGNINIKDKNGKEGNIKLTPKDKELLRSNKDNPEILNNLVDFYMVLQELRLDNLWNYKEAIFNVIGGPGSGFDTTDGNFLDKLEIQKFLNAILKATGKEEIKEYNFETFKNTFLNETKNETKQEGKILEEGENEFVENFLNKFKINDKTGSFDQGKFKDRIK